MSKSTKTKRPENEDWIDSEDDNYEEYVPVKKKKVTF